MKTTKLIWFDTEYLRSDLTIQPVVVRGEIDTLLYTMFDCRGYQYVFGSIRELMEYVYEGKNTYMVTFETEAELLVYLKNF